MAAEGQRVRTLHAERARLNSIPVRVLSVALTGQTIPRAVLAAIPVVLALITVACGSPTSERQVSEPGLLTASERQAVIEDLQQLGSAGTVTFSVEVEPRSFHFCGGLSGGVFETRTTTDGSTGQVDLDADGIADAVRSEDTIWIRTPTDFVEHDTHGWVRLDFPMSMAEFGLAQTSALGPALVQLGVGPDATGNAVDELIDSLTLLVNESPEITRSEATEVDGVELGALHMTTESGLSMTLWFDDGGTLREVEVRTNQPTKRQSEFSRATLDRFGESVDVEPPQATDVIAFSDLSAAAVMGSSTSVEPECQDESRQNDVAELRNCIEQLGNRKVGDVLAGGDDSVWLAKIDCPTSPLGQF